MAEQEKDDAAVVAAPDPSQEDPVVPKKDDKPTEEAPEKQEDVLEIDPDDISRDNDGNLVWKVDPSDPKSTVYVGKNLKELLANARKGLTDKDQFIRELQSKAKIPTASHSKSIKGEGATVEVEFPDQEKIVEKHAKAAGIEPEMLSYSNAKWREYADAQGLETLKSQT